ncbi:MAG: T9SS type A sorting domain-containing protein [Bacteroidota bacterium]|nr:T9SS type A sorting domain-containing protein [Bacteroidota bacterium]
MCVPHSSGTSQACKQFALALVLIFIAVGSSRSQNIVTTSNKYVTALVDPISGLVTVYVTPAVIGKQLSYDSHSYFTCQVDGKFYTNNQKGQFTTTPLPTQLWNGATTKIADTIRTIWANLNGVDVIQDIYPFAFTKSGQIVFKWKFLNHRSVPVSVACQYLLDEQITDPTELSTPNHPNSVDGPWILTRWDYNDNWRTYPTSLLTIPWFYCAFLYTLPNGPSYYPGLSAQGYTDYAPMGLIPPVKMTIGDWTKMINDVWGTRGSGSTGPDCATLFEWQPQTVLSGQTAEVGRTSYGTGEFETCNGDLFGILFYPHHLSWTKAGISGYYTPNPFDVQFYAFNPNQFAGAADTKLTLTVGGTLNIYDSVNHKVVGKSQVQPTSGSGTFINPGAVSIPVFEWFVKADPAYFCRGDVHDTLIFTGSSSLGSFAFREPSNNAVECDHDLVLDCAETDIDPPIWSVLTDTNILVRDIHVHDDRPTDRGLHKITWHPTAKRDSANALNFVITFSGPIKLCPTDKDIHTVHIVQLDSTLGACFDFTYEDCVGNQSFETVCMPPHPRIIIPDTLKPVYHIDLQSGSFDGSECNSRLDSFDVRDDRLHDKGLDSVFVMGTPVNIIAAIDTFPKHSPLVRFTITVVDSLRDGAVCIRAIDGAGNYRDTCIFYCTIHDTIPPLVAIVKDPTRRGKWTVNVSDNRPWDRFIDSIFIVTANNVTFPPTGINPLRKYTSGQSEYSFVVTAIDTMQVSSICVRANDLMGNMSEIVCSYQGIDTDALCPNISISPDPKTSPTSVSTFVDDIHFNDPPANTDTNIWDTGIDKIWFSDNTGIIAPDTIYGYCKKNVAPFTLSVLDTLKIDTLSCVTINAQDCHGNICTYTWCYPYIGDSLPPILTAHYVGKDSIAVQVSDSRVYDRGLKRIQTLGEINLSPFDTVATSAGLWLKQFGLTRPKPDESTLGSLHAVDFWGSLLPNPRHEALVNFAVWVQDFSMRKGVLLRQGSAFTVPVYFVRNDSFPVASKGITDFSFSFSINDPAGLVSFDRVSTVNTETANWTVTANTSGQSVQVTGTMLPNGKPLTADMAGDPPDSLLVLHFTTQPSISTQDITLVIDSIVFNNGHDTTYYGLSATAVMPPPLGSMSGSRIVIVGSCAPIVTSDSVHPTAVSLDPNHPNPFSHITTFTFTVAQDGPVQLAIYDLLGKEIARPVDGFQKQGLYSVTFDGSSVSEGSYIARLQAGGVVVSRLIGIEK